MTQSISMQDLYRRLNELTGKELILDVREPDEYGAGHVPGSRNIPLACVKDHLDELRSYDRVYVHCQRGGRAGKAADSLRGLGLSNIVCISSSGMADWLAAGYPIEK